MKRTQQFFSRKNDHGGDFWNESLCKLFESFGITYNFSTPRTAQQNGIVARKIRDLVEMARIILNVNSKPKHFWTEAVNTIFYL